MGSESSIVLCKPYRSPPDTLCLVLILLTSLSAGVRTRVQGSCDHHVCSRKAFSRTRQKLLQEILGFWDVTLYVWQGDAKIAAKTAASVFYPVSAICLLFVYPLPTLYLLQL